MHSLIFITVNCRASPTTFSTSQPTPRLRWLPITRTTNLLCVTAANRDTELALNRLRQDSTAARCCTSDRTMSRYFGGYLYDLSAHFICVSSSCLPNWRLLRSPRRSRPSTNRHFPRRLPWSSTRLQPLRLSTSPPPPCTSRPPICPSPPLRRPLDPSRPRSLAREDLTDSSAKSSNVSRS